ncbi:MAG: hypothetical protein RLZ98_1453 [Pseudomonadota bacterium]|jgi:3-hydroxyisobutyrate dehydrogenase-like beta-hydroxyacid dehydrogenase
MSESETIALIGFGEAGQNVAAGFANRPDVALRTYDIRFDDPRDDLKSRTEAFGVRACASSAEGVDGAGIVFSFVVGSQAVAAARTAAPSLKPGQLYIDCNSVSPGTKKAVGEALEGTGCHYVEAAVMAPVPPYRHEVPILLAGPEARAVAERLNAIGMRCEEAGSEIGQASLNKMLRSIMIKGIEALLFESMAVAQKYGIEERILDSVAETLPGLDWRQLTTYDLGRIAIHGVRRASEMKESAATVAECGFDPIMAEAISRRIYKAHALIGNHDWPHGEPRDYKEIFAVLNARLAAKGGSE